MGKGRGEYAGAHPFYSKCKHKKKGYREFLQAKENYLMHSMPQTASGYSRYGGRPAPLNCGFRAAGDTV